MDNENEKSREGGGIESEIKRGKHGYFLEGTAPGPGRPKGSKSIKDAVRKYLEQNPEDFEEFISHFIKKNRELAWQMLEGKPQQDIVSDGKQLPTPIYIPRDDSPEEDKPSE